MSARLAQRPISVFVLLAFVFGAANFTFSQTDNWLGGTGYWSNGSNWSAGLPIASSDVVINSGGTDLVYFDTGTAINSLTIGNDGFCPCSDLETATTLTLDVAGPTLIAQTGSLGINGGTVNTSSLVLHSFGSVVISSGTLNLTNQLGGLTNIPFGAYVDIAGGFNDVLGGSSGFAHMTSVAGELILENGQTITITPNGGLLSVNTPYTNLDVSNNSYVIINGDVHNFGGSEVSVDSFPGNSGSRLDVTGNFFNDAGSYFILANAGSVVNFGSFTNKGAAFITASLNLTNQPNGITDVVAGSQIFLVGNLETFTAGPNNALYQLTSVEGTLGLENSQTTTSTPIKGTFTIGSAGYVEVATGTTFNINGNVVIDPGGTLSINDPFPTGVNITGTLTNNGGHVNVVGPNGFLNAGGIGNGGLLTLPEGSTVNLASGFYQLAKGTLGETIGASGFSILAVNGGLVMLDGKLDVMLDPGFNPAIGTIYKFLLFNDGALSGTFSTIDKQPFNNGTEYWVVNYDNANGYVSLTAESVPEPSSLWLLGSGLLSVAYGVRRRRPH